MATQREPIEALLRERFEAWCSAPTRLTVGARLNAGLKESLWLCWQDAWQAALAAASNRAPPDDGELWSFLRSVMAKGSDFGIQFNDGLLSYEHHSAHLDAEASHFAKRLRAMLAARPEPKP